MADIGHLLNRTLDVWRPGTVDDGMGGQTATMAWVGAVDAKVDLPSAKEAQTAQQWAADLSHNIFLEPGVDVRRGDELRGAGQTFRVLATVQPSRGWYLKCPASEMREPEGAQA